MKPIPLNALAKILERHHTSQILIKGCAIDSRKVHPGDLFFALPGNKVDGHQFLKEAKEKGAAACILKEGYSGETFGLPFLCVKDVLATLQDLARKKLQKRKSKVVAITGSLGKTSTKEFTAALFRTKYRVFSSPLSYNSQATLPLSVLMADGGEDILLLEMGMTHPGQIAKLISIAPPDIAAITHVAMQHANNFSDGLDGICKEKASIFSHAKTQLGLLLRDIIPYEKARKVGNCQKQDFSIKDRSADYFLEVVHGGKIRIFFENQLQTEIDVSFPLKVYYQNFLASVALARAVGVPWEMIRETAPSLKPPPMRFETIVKRGITFINDAYNANPDSMIAALESLPEPKIGGKKIAVLSEMDALGTYSEIGHKEVAIKALQHADTLFCLGSRCALMKEVWEGEKREAICFETKEKLLETLKESIHPGDVVLLKGARSYSLESLLESF